MTQSLFFRLMGAFALVILVGFAVVYLIANQATTSEFQYFMFRGQMVAVQDIADQLAQYYRANGTFNGAEALLRASGPSMGMGGMMGRGMGSPRLWLADARGMVVASSDNSRQGQVFSASELGGGTPIRVGGQTVGTLLVDSGMMGTPTDTSSRDFLAEVNRSLLLAGVVAGLIALALGFVLFRQITAPLNSLARATREIAAGDLKTRVDVRGKDEVSRVGLAFNAMAENLQRSEAARRNMLADIAHELRNPLGVIQSHLEAMLDGVFPTNPEQVASLHEETMLLTRLVDDLRDLALADAGELSLARVPTDLGLLIARATEAFKPQAGERDIKLTCEVGGNVPPISLDPHRIDQVLRNLLSNALRYAAEGSQVSVHLSRDADAARVEVRDTGPGIPPNALEHVFERFWRADKSRSRQSGGSGLGLAIAQQLIQAHGGQIGATSQVGHGTTFWFTLPVDAGKG